MSITNHNSKNLRNEEVSGIVYKYLVENGYSGLCNMDNECGCEIDDLFPCCDCLLDCVAAYKIVVPDNVRVDSDIDFYVCTDKNAKPWEDDDND